MNPTGFRGKSITPRMLAQIEKDLDQPKANKKEIADRHGLSIRTVRNIDKARRTPPIPVKGVVKNI